MYNLFNYGLFLIFKGLGETARVKILKVIRVISLKYVVEFSILRINETYKNQHLQRPLVLFLE